MKKTQKFLAWAGIALLTATVIFFLVSAFFIKDPVYFKASLGCIIAIPILLYAFLMISKAVKPQKSPLIDNIVFDVGNVLIDFGWKKVMEDLGYSDETINYLAENLIHDPLWNQFDTGRRPYDSVTDEFCQRHPQYENEIRTFLKHMPDAVIPRTYVPAWLSDLKSKGYHLYILSNWAEPVFESAKDTTLAFRKMMDGAIWSYQAKCIKPEKKIYQKLINTYHLDPSRTIFLDDKKENIDAAANFGIHGIVVTTDHQKTLSDLKNYGIK